MMHAHSRHHRLQRRFSAAYLSLAVLLAVVLALPALAADTFDPEGIFLTWQQDPTTTMTIDWHINPDDEQEHAELQYKERNASEWNSVASSKIPFPHSDRIIRRAELTNLKPYQEYSFRFGDDTKSYWFRTMPADNSKPVRFVTGGDLNVGKRFRAMNAVAMKHNPDFFVWGGDLAYANDLPYGAPKWQTWFKDIKETLITEDGRAIPMIAGIGNHETFVTKRLLTRYESAAKGSKSALADLPNARKGMSEEEQKKAAEEYMREQNAFSGRSLFYDTLFAFPNQPGNYGILDFGDYLSLFVLNSGHGKDSSVTGPQKEWLEKNLQERAGKFTNIIPIYHVPAYPVYRNPKSGSHVQIRENWLPLFEKYGVRMAFENHDHAYKRTVPILAEKEDSKGIVFIGDGGWGTERKKVHPADETWYLKRSIGSAYALYVTLDGDKQEYKAVNVDGETMDEYSDNISRTANR